MFQRCITATKVIVALAIAAVALAACSDDSFAVCGTAEFDQLPAVLAPLDTLGDSDQSAVTDALVANENWDGRDWRVVSDSDDLVLFGTPTDSNFPYGHATFDRDGDRLELQDASNCNLAFNTPGMNIASFRLDPQQPLDPDTVVVPILFTEKACASGGALNGRDVQPSVIESDDRIEILVLIETYDGAALCPGNAEVSWAVELDAPIGQRAIADASVIPARNVRD